MSIVIRYRFNSKYKPLLGITTLTNRLIRYPISLRIASLTHDSKVSLTFANDVSFLILFHYRRQLPRIPRLRTVVNTRDSSPGLWLLGRVCNNNIETLG